MWEPVGAKTIGDDSCFVVVYPVIWARKGGECHAALKGRGTYLLYWGNLLVYCWVECFWTWELAILISWRNVQTGLCNKAYRVKEVVLEVSVCGGVGWIQTILTCRCWARLWEARSGWRLKFFCFWILFVFFLICEWMCVQIEWSVLHIWGTT